jgi:hypothetical protein
MKNATTHNDRLISKRTASESVGISQSARSRRRLATRTVQDKSVLGFHGGPFVGPE